MATRSAPLKPRQLSVLRWIANGCPDGVMEGFTYKTTALALQGRRLVSVSKRGGVWRAEVTAAGRYYLARGRYPDGPWETRQYRTRRAATPQPPSSGAEPEEVPAPRRQRTATTAQQTARPASVTERLVADVLAAGGELRVNRSVDEVNYHQRVAAAIRFGKVPPGKLLSIAHGRRWEDLVIRLTDQPAWMTATLEPIVVPAQLRKPHPLVGKLRSDAARLPFTPTVRNRALRLVHALATAVEARGYVVDLLPEPLRAWRGQGSRVPWNRSGDEVTGHVSVTVKGHTFGVLLNQETDRTEHVPTAAELRRAEQESWYRIPRYDYESSDRISIKVTNGREYRQSVWADGSTGLIDAKLPQVLQELELRAGFAEEQRLADERHREERRRRWEAAMARAKVDLREAHRGKVLRMQAERWREAKLLRGYLAAMRSVIGDMEDGDLRAEANVWLRWATENVEDLDPLHGTLAMPEDPAPTPEALRPFLHGWSPYGP